MWHVRIRPSIHCYDSIRDGRLFVDVAIAKKNRPDCHDHDWSSSLHDYTCVLADRAFEFFWSVNLFDGKLRSTILRFMQLC